VSRNGKAPNLFEQIGAGKAVKPIVSGRHTNGTIRITIRFGSVVVVVEIPI
jgi:hypothetical protein